MTTISYDQFFLEPVKERLRIFNEISAENRASLVKTQAERWLGANRARLIPEQLTVVDEVIRSISTDWYEPDRNPDEIEPEIGALIARVEAVLSREDVREFVTVHAEHIPPVED